MILKRYIALLLSVTALTWASSVREQSTLTLQTGPELLMGYHPDIQQNNPVDCFMYFVPLTSPIGVSIETAAGTTFSANFISWDRRQNGQTITVECDFDITGQGRYAAVYDADEMIRKRLPGADEQSPKELTKLLEYISLSGPCQGRIKGVGTMIGDNVQMERIEVSFNRDNSESPVEVSMYDIPRKRGLFSYGNRRNCQVARINCLTFKRNDDGAPRMSVEIASLKKARNKEGFFSHLTAVIANILSTSTAVAPLGNATMMDFGTALCEKQAAFTFPKATNIKQ